MRFIENSQRVVKAAVRRQTFRPDRDATVADSGRKSPTERQTPVFIHRFKSHQLGKQIIRPSDQLQIKVSSLNQVSLQPIGVMEPIFLGEQMYIRRAPSDPFLHNGLEVADYAVIGGSVQIKIFDFLLTIVDVQLPDL